MRTRFRGITVREGVLLRGPAGWGEWSPFLEYDAARSPSPGCAAPRRPRPATGPTPVRDRGAGQRHRARRRPRARARDRAAPAAAAPPRSRSPSPARPSATTRPGSRRCATRSAPTAGSASTPTAAGTSTTAVAAIRLLDRAAGGLEYVEQPCASVEELAAVRRRGRRADRRRRVDPPGRRPLPRPRPRGRRHRGAQGAAARRGAGLPADRRGHRPAGRRLLGAGDARVGIAAGRRAGRRAARAAVRLRAGHRAAAHRRRGRRAAAAGRRRAAGAPCRRSTRTRWTGSPPAPDRVAHWEARLAEVRAPCGRIGRRDRSRHRPLARAVVGALVEAGVTEVVLAPGLAQRPARLRGVRRGARPGCCGCTPGSTSARPASSPSG